MLLRLLAVVAIAAVMLSARGLEGFEVRELEPQGKPSDENRAREEAFGAFPAQDEEAGGKGGRGLSAVKVLVSGGHDGGSDDGEVEGDVDKMDRRDYLNRLVDVSSTKTETQVSNIAFVKTHKTASTTMAYLFFRYARRHKLKLAHFDGHNSAVPLEEAVAQTKEGKGRVDIMHYHHSTFGQYDGTWEKAERDFRDILRDDKKINFVTVVRDPRTHLLSYYYYFMQPVTKQSIEHFLMKYDHPGHDAHHRLFNPLAAEFGIRTPSELQSMLDSSLNHFLLMILTEEFDEGLMVLRRLLGWDMIDMTYCSMYKTKKGATRYDGKPLVDVPRFEDLSKPAQDAIDALTGLDRILYDAAKKQYMQRRNVVADHLEADLEEFVELQDVVKTYLHTNSSSEANAMYKTANIYSTKSPFHPF